jgi:glutathionyl-hydroquinone reductase
MAQRARERLTKMPDSTKWFTDDYLVYQGRRLSSGDRQPRYDAKVPRAAYSFNCSESPYNNGGVYRCGFAGSQEAYDAAYDRLFAALDWVSDRLTSQRYLLGDTSNEADVRLFTTLARFDAVYHRHFKCNRAKLSEMPVLWAYARDLFQTPGFGDTVDFVQIKQHYYIVHSDINPTRIVPKGPELTGWLTPHGREVLGGKPFGDGTPPGPPRDVERVPAGHGA